MSEKLTARLERRTVIAPAVLEIVFRMLEPERLAFRAGQVVPIDVRRKDGGLTPRTFSIASAGPGETLRLITRVYEGGAASAFFAGLTTEDRVTLTGPDGGFVLDPAHGGDLVLAATGTGI